MRLIGSRIWLTDLVINNENTIDAVEAIENEKEDGCKKDEKGVNMKIRKRRVFLLIQPQRAGYM